MLPDIKIAQKAIKKPIGEIASRLKINKKYLYGYGRYIAKIDLGILETLPSRPRGKYILVTAITPTPLGEGKTVTTIGLGMALNRLGKLASVCLRQPSLGPVFGIKGSAAGGGYAQVLPRGDFDLHFTGDAHAVALAHNVAAAFLDNSIFRGNKFNIALDKIYWQRCVDIGDRVLRNIRIGLGNKSDGVPRDSGFEITAASEIMAILALSSNLRDLKKRLGRIVLAQTKQGRFVTTQDLKVAGLMAVLLKDALKPNLIQTIENTPCFVHTGPFANIAHGNSSIIQDKIALALSDYVVTEAGFGADCGAEKFFDIKCRISGLVPSLAVIVCSIRALKVHGVCNLQKQIENVMIFGVPVIVAINRFACDTDKEIDFVKRKAQEFGAYDCCVSEVWLKGSQGGLELARAVISLSKEKTNFKFLYPLNTPIKEKIKVIATKIYGAGDVEYSSLAKAKIKLYTERGYDKLPICMAKTHLSLSHDPHLLGMPRDFILPVRDIRASIGAGFLYPLCGAMQTMPGLPTHPKGEHIDINLKGDIIGLS